MIIQIVYLFLSESINYTFFISVDQNHAPDNLNTDNR